MQDWEKIGFAIVASIVFCACAAFIIRVVVANKVHDIVSAYNRALCAWCTFATNEMLQDAYPVAIEIEGDEARFALGLEVKKVVVVARTNFTTARYRLKDTYSVIAHFELEKSRR